MAISREEGLRGGVRGSTRGWADGGAELEAPPQAWPERDGRELASFTMLLFQNKSLGADSSNFSSLSTLPGILWWEGVGAKEAHAPRPHGKAPGYSSI